MNYKNNFIKIFTILLLFFIILNSFSIVSNVKSIPSEKTEFIVITPLEFYDCFPLFIDHKKEQDISTKVITLDDIYNSTYFTAKGRDNSEKIKYFIKNSIENWETKYVMLVGTKELLPARSSTIYLPFISFKTILNPVYFQEDYLSKPMELITWNYYSDLYYADIYDIKGNFCSWDTNGNNIFGEKSDRLIIDKIDLFPDVAVGRLLCSTVEDVDIVLSKIIQYEKNTADSDWFERIIVCGGDTHSFGRDILFKILPIFSQMGPLDNEIAFEGEYMGDKAVSFLPDFTATRIYSTGTLRSDAIPITSENINAEIEKGAGFLLLSGHGYPEAWATHPPFLSFIWLPYPDRYSISDVEMLSNNEKLPVAIFSACSMGDFKETDNPIAWEFVQHQNGGGIACFACTTLGTLLPTTLCTESLNGFLSLNVIKLFSEGNIVLGDVWRGTIDNYLNDDFALELGNLAKTSWLNYFNVEQWILFGDPTLKIGGYSSIDKIFE